ncbi:MAG: hypothetical protein KFF77_08705 [Bacteroidetes bacterium]|nr:hypothetical protein [Bacteroidota bacterium]
MAVRISITTLFILGMLCAMLAPLRQSVPWVAEYAIVATTPSLPVHGSEAEQRERTVSTTATVHSPRQRRVPRIAETVDVPPPRPRPPRPDATPLPPANPRNISESRAPPAVC